MVKRSGLDSLYSRELSWQRGLFWTVCVKGVAILKWSSLDSLCQGVVMVKYLILTVCVKGVVISKRSNLDSLCHRCCHGKNVLVWRVCVVLPW